MAEPAWKTPLEESDEPEGGYSGVVLRRATAHRFRIRGYRLGAGRRYQAIEPDREGRLLSETAGLRFGASPDGQWVEIFVAATGERLLTSWEAEEKAAREAEGRKAAEEELVRLRAEIERLKNRA